MKKTLVALSVLAAASAQAGVNIYENEGVSVVLGGDIEVVYVQDKGYDQEFTQEIQDADLSMDVRYTASDSLQFGAFWQINDVGVDAAGANDGDAYVAIYSDQAGTFKVGRTCAALDDAGIGSDFQFGLNTFFGGDDSHYCADETIRWDLDRGAFYATAAFVQDKNGDEGLADDANYFDGKLGYRVADFDLTAFYGNGEVGVVGATHDETLWSAQVRYNGIENLALALAYYNTDDESQSVDTLGLAATYTMGKMTYAAGFSASSSDDSSVEDFDTWYVNAGYGIAPQTTLYAEVGGDNGTTTDSNGNSVDNDAGFAVGVKAWF